MTQALVTGLAVSGMYVLLSLGFTLQLRLADIVNVAHGTVVVGGMYVAIVFVNDLGVPYAAAVPLAVGACLVPAWIAYEAILRRARSQGHGPQIIYTLLLLSLLETIYQRVFGPDLVRIDIPTQSWEIFGAVIQREQVIGGIVAVVVCAVLFLVFRYTAIGKAIEVAGSYRDGALAIGLPVERLYRVVFLVGTAMGVLGGALIVASVPVTPFLSFDYLIVAVVIALAARLSFIGCVLASLLYGVGYQVLVELLDDPGKATIAIYAVFMVAIAATQFSGSVQLRWPWRNRTAEGST